MTDQELSKLLKLKKAETPGEVYFSQFLTEFHRYQRAEILHKPTFSEKLGEWFTQLLPTPRMTYAFSGCAALALLAAGAFALLPVKQASFSTASMAPFTPDQQLATFTTYADASHQQPELLPSATPERASTYVTGTSVGHYETVVTF